MKPTLLHGGKIFRAGLAAILVAVLAGTCLAQVVIPDSLKRHPDYWRPHDPESLSVFLGRRPNAPLVQLRFKKGARSLDELGRRVCGAINHAAYDSLWTLCVTDTEFRVILWPEFPQSRPATGLQWDDAWTFLLARLHAGCNHAMRDYGGHVWEFVGFMPDSVAHYKNFILYSQVFMNVRNEANQTQRWTWLKAVVERKGTFKIYSTED